MRRLAPLAALLVLLAAGRAEARVGLSDFSLGGDFPFFLGATPKLMAGQGYFLEVNVPRGGAIHSLRLGYEEFGLGSGPGSRTNAEAWVASYRLFRRPAPGGRLLPFAGVGLGSYSGGMLRGDDGNVVDGTAFDGDLGLNLEVGGEIMWSPSLRGVGLRLSANAVLLADDGWVTFPMALLIWVG